MKRSLIQRKLARVDRALDKAIESAEMAGAVVFARMPREGERLEHWSVRGNAVTSADQAKRTFSSVWRSTKVWLLMLAARWWAARET